MSKSQKKTYSVYDPEIRSEHREFFENIVNELMTIFPVCNQGRSLAESINDGQNEQIHVIGDLMQQAENYGRDLLPISRNLFDQFYQVTASYAEFIYTNSAYLTINLMERSLLERTCDVRWWAMETAFSDCIEPANELLSRLRNSGSSEIAEHAVEILCTSEAAHTYLAVDCQDPELLAAVLAIHSKFDFACSRLEDIRSSYTLYRDLVITTDDGIVIANANSQTRMKVIGTSVADEEWFQRGVATSDGNQYFAQDVKDSVLEGEQSLIYSTAIRSGADVKGSVIGAMGVCFDFSSEAEVILNEAILKNDKGELTDGWHCFFTNSAGVVLHSSDEIAFPTNSKAYIPLSHRNLEKGETKMSFSNVLGVESAIFSAKSNGHSEYEGLGWSSHLVVPKSHIFESQSEGQFEDLDMKKLHLSKILPEVNVTTYNKLTQDHQNITRISLNGIIFATHIGGQGRCLAPVFDHITQTGNKVGRMMDSLLSEMAKGELCSNLLALEKFADQAINIVDRNLFERSADVRWWATDSFFWKVLEEPTSELCQEASSRLRVINDSYTMYRNLVLADANGKVIACSNEKEMSRLSGVSVGAHDWFTRAMATSNAKQYAVQDVADSDLETDEGTSLIYSAGVRAEGASSGSAIGAIGICFDWETETQEILEKCVPLDFEGKAVEGCCAFFTNAEMEVIQTSSPDLFPIGKRVNFSSQYVSELKAESSNSGFITLGETEYIVGSVLARGYREYPGLGWSAHVVRPFIVIGEEPVIAENLEEGFFDKMDSPMEPNEEGVVFDRNEPIVN